MTYSGNLLPPHARPSAQEFAGLARPDIIWEDERWYRFTERTDLHEVRYLEVRQDGQTVAPCAAADHRKAWRPAVLRPAQTGRNGRRAGRAPSCSTHPTNSAGPN